MLSTKLLTDPPAALDQGKSSHFGCETGLPERVLLYKLSATKTPLEANSLHSS